jgi:periplasmic divalent cation tolerance protein
LGHVQVQFAIDDPERADVIVESLLAAGLVACGQRLGPVSSRYWWNGSRQQASEWLVLVKTRSELATRVIESIVADHPYEVPEVVVLGIDRGAPAYLEWIDAVTAAPRVGPSPADGDDGGRSGR